MANLSLLSFKCGVLTLVYTWHVFPWYMLLSVLISNILLNVLQAKRKRARTPTPGEYLGVRGIYLNSTAIACVIEFHVRIAWSASKRFF